mmetsp:Transcript_51418/g.76919  ORF Transcript_51418/g.76919 Transcript_51418/m.76919 type:complete len:94 (+) Transcript_51418:51-332(+)
MKTDLLGGRDDAPAVYGFRVKNFPFSKIPYGTQAHILTYVDTNISSHVIGYIPSAQSLNSSNFTCESKCEISSSLFLYESSQDACCLVLLSIR